MRISSRDEIVERIAKCQKILQSNPGSQIFAALAEAHRKKGDPDSAFRVCQKGLKMHPDYGSAHVVMAKINLDKGMYDWAEMEVTKAAATGANTHAVALLRSEILIYQGKRDEAASQLSKMLKKDPSNQQVIDMYEIATRKNINKFQDDNIVASPIGNIAVKNVPPPNPTFFGSANRVREPLAPVERKRLSAIEVLKQGAEIEGFVGAALLDSKNKKTQSHWTGELSEKACIDMSKSILKNLQSGLSDLGFGELSTVLVGSAGAHLYLTKHVDEVFVFFGDGSVNQSRMRGIASRAVADYEK